MRKAFALINQLLVFTFATFLCHSQVTYEVAFPNIDFDFPVEIQNANDGSNRLFIVEQQGRIKVFPNSSGVITSEVSTFLDISSKVSFNEGQELGLLGLCFHPNFSTNRYIYVYYTDRPGNYQMNLSRFQVDPTNPNTIDPNTETVIFQFEKNQDEWNHNGGKIAFGPDGYLYISIGDGGGGGDPLGNAQNLDNAFGSILRIDVDVDGSNTISGNGNYEIPSDNPRVGQSGLDELYAWGIRNTWKFSFDGNLLYGADVGQGSFEEINIIENGSNYGWSRFEGNSLYDSSTPLTTSPDVKPIFTYDHNNGDLSITGGYVYRGASTNNSLQGKYIYGDFVTGRIWSLDYDSSNGSASSEFLFRTNGQAISSFGLDEAGELYFSDYGYDVKIYSITDGNTGPVTTAVNGVGGWLNSGNNGVNGIVETIANDGNDTFYVGGEFDNASGTAVSNLAIFNKSNGWSSFGSGTNGKVNAIAIANNGNVYVGGDFSSIAGITVSNIAYWDGTTWNPLGSGTSGPVSKIGIDGNDNVYVGGAFETAGGTTVNNIALWSSGTWNALVDSSNSVSGTNNEIRSIAFDENNILIVGGNFGSAGGNSASRIATWNGTNWNTLGDGTSGFVQAIDVTANYIYAAGNFALAGGETVNRIARWNRSNLSWEALNNGLSGSVNTLSHDGTYLYVGGSFETASDVTDVNEIMNNIARFSDAEGWEALGPGTSVGVETTVNALVFNNDSSKLLVGGNFSNVGPISAENIAEWGNQGCINSSITPQYTINGSTSNGENNITINEGDTMILGIVQDLFFTITLPDNSIITGNYDFGIASNSQQGTYTFTSIEGCTEDIEIAINLDPNGDEDNDGVINSQDNCPSTPNGETVNSEGCADSQLDDDNDGVPDVDDICPNTPDGETVNQDGCGDSQLDDDNDGVSNADDICPNTPSGETTDSLGCSASQQDIDNDGVSNIDDLCNDTPDGETVDSNGCSQSQLDDDNDGVSNSEDQCPNTPPNTFVDPDGCETFTLPIDNFTIATISTTCRGVFDGQLSIDADLELDYTARLTSTSFSETRNFTDVLIIDELPSGTYELCITVQNIQDYESCSTVVIDAPASLSVFSIVDEINQSVTLQMLGGDEFFVTMNETTFNITSNEVTLKLVEESNKIKVSTGQECQGVFEETIIISKDAWLYPNPFENTVTLNTSRIDEPAINYVIYNIGGQQLLENTIELDGMGKIEIPLYDLASGVFILKLNLKDSQQIFKLVKR